MSDVVRVSSPQSGTTGDRQIYLGGLQVETSVAIAVSLGSERLEDDRCLGRLVRRILDPDASADTGERGLASPCCLKVHIGAVRY